ncbi:SGNH/GDSL hydrolase family protein [Streptomyces sp. NPDC002039]|uniref:golvesin C-terminal-like domain-containing protein n=1 Tax=Streptomyces sp. NPDC002039 TaxID=3154660 RepID=UPI00332C99D2
MAAAGFLAGLIQVPASAAGPSGPVTPDPSTPRASVPAAKRDDVLGRGWRTADDRAVTVVGDAYGLHVLVSESGDGYEWREAATLREQGLEADAWVGNVCVTGSGKRAVVAYAPRAFTNTPSLFDRGAFAAVVDLETHAVTKMSETVSLAYFNPGCGAGETVVLTQSADAEAGKTRLLRLDAATGKVASELIVPGEATSAVPVGDSVIAALGGKLARIAPDGAQELIGETSGPAFRIHPDAGGAVAFLDREGESVRVRRAVGAKVTELARGGLGKVSLAAGAAGRLFITGQPKDIGPLPPGITKLAADAGSEVSSGGRLVIDHAVSAALRSHVADPLAAPDTSHAPPYRIKAHAPVTGRSVDFLVPGAAESHDDQPSPALPGTAAPTTKSPRATLSAQAALAGSSTSTVDPERTCSVPRNDPAQQALQPTPNQVEWAVDMAIRGNLTSGWMAQGGWRAQDGLGSSVAPSTMFPQSTLIGGPAGGRIPAQVLLGVLAQESNLWQASYHALPGQTGNPLVGNFYGTNIYPGTPGYDPDKIWTIDWAKADCGYGMGQQTDGMSVPGRVQTGKPPAMPADKQRAVALDYAANVAVAAQTLADKWSELHIPGQTVQINNDDPKYIENWFAAVWNYNLGFNKPDSSGRWGLGWLNNPANPKYPADRNAFLDNNHYADAATPQKWPYPEKVMGWAAYPIDTGRSYSDAGVQNSGNTHGYQAAWWSDAGARTRAIKPPLDTFCNASNGCNAGSPPRCADEACYKLYWYHANAKWKTACATECGNETLTYKTLRAELGRGNSGLPDCTTSGRLPSNALIIDDVSASAPTLRSDCSKSWTNSGTMSWNFTDPAGLGTYEGKEDLHQVGGGFGAHFWFAHTRNSGNRIDQMKVTGTWTLARTLNQWSRVMVHLPDNGAETQQAHYRIALGNGTVKDRYINQLHKSNTWISLGVYNFSGTPSVSLTNETVDGTADDDVAWDAIAFQPLPGKPKNIVASLGDSFSSGEGSGSVGGPGIGYSWESDTDHGTPRWNGCRRSVNAWPRKLTPPNTTTPLGTAGDAWSTDAELSFVACSGAQTWNVQGTRNPSSWTNRGAYSWSEGQFHEMSQIDSGALDENTTLVTLTIGGNDEGAFVGAVMECAGGGDCATDATFMPRYKALADKLGTSLGSLITSIKARATHATIVVMGYPELMSRSRACLAAGLFNVNEQKALGDLSKYVNGKQAAAVQGVQGVTYADPIPMFSGHGTCDDDEWINAIVTGPNGNGDFHHKDFPDAVGNKPSFCLWDIAGGACLSRESFHPKTAGTTGYAKVMEQKLRDIGYGAS